ITFCFGSRPMIERDSTDFPEPDSPTIPSVCPRSSVNDTPSTARVNPRGVLNDVWRSMTSRRRSEGFCGSARMPRPPFRLRNPMALDGGFADVEASADDVAEVVDRHHREEDGERRHEDDLRRRADVLGQLTATDRDHVAPRRRRRWHADTEDAETALDGDHHT